MDAHEESVFNNVKLEKAKAISRYNRFLKITKVLQFLEVFVVLILISWSSTKLPAALRFSGNLLLEIAGYIFKPHVVFLIGNAIIVALVVLCRENDAGNQSSGTGDIYYDYLRHSQAAQQPKVSVSDSDYKISKLPAAEIKETIAVVGDSDEKMKQIVCVRSEEENPEQYDDDVLATAIENATKQIEKFQRTQSEKLKRDIAGKPRRQFRRSETERQRVEKHVMTSFDSMDNLSIEEFNLKVDNFIRRMKTPEFLKQQILLETVD